MKKLVFALSGLAAITFGGCNYNSQDQVNNAEMNQPATDLNALSNEAANDAANSEADALGNQENQLENESANTLNPSDAQEQNVSGM
ncbi:hypothetical protein [Sphingomonas sp. URHD0057]|uniref:hypothetical protein n=1 Tax=Sphingomonas sp. URHD0057 TaxID=1380389 RepID=UPI0012DC5DA2|nr:hypothetical protein [Sphingomonas sp. URHD0057]